MVGEAEYTSFRAALLAHEMEDGWLPVLRFSAPFSHWGCHEGLEVIEKAINELSLDEPESAMKLRKLHLARSVLKQCLQHGFMAPGEPPAEPETEPIQEEVEPCTSAISTVAAGTGQLESEESSENDTPSPIPNQDQSADDADEPCNSEVSSLSANPSSDRHSDEPLDDQ